MNIDYTTLIGISGAAIVLLAFVMAQTKRWKDDDPVYDFWNLVGGALLVWYALLLKSYPFAVLNSVWAAVSLKDVAVFLLKKRDQK